MLDKFWSSLKNGSDIRGIAIETESQKVNLTYEVVSAISAAFGLWLSEKTGLSGNELKIAIGRDSRLSGERIKSAAIKALAKAGCEIIDCGLLSTPAAFMTCVDESLQCHGAIQITASHLPFDRNGLKFFTREGGLNSSDIDIILNYAQKGISLPTSREKEVKHIDFLSIYSKGLVDLVRKSVNAENYDAPLSGFHIVVDAGNGVGGFFVDNVLKPLGADTRGSQFLEPDGNFPNHIPNPEDKEAMKSICSCVLENKADLGIIFDTDVDRAAAVEKQGREINRNRLIALASAIVLEQEPGATIVTDSVTSTGLTEFINDKLGGSHHRFKRGYKNVINEAIRLNSSGVSCPLAIETSGHAAFKENYFLDDGAFLVIKLLIKMAQLRKEGKTIDDLITDLREPKESAEFRMNISHENFKEYGNMVIEETTEYSQNTPGWNIAPDNYEGIRVYFGDNMGNGWFLLRMSLHEPLMPLNIESDVDGGTKVIARHLASFLKRFEFLDTKKLIDFAQ